MKIKSCTSAIILLTLSLVGCGNVMAEDSDSTMQRATIVMEDDAQEQVHSTFANAVNIEDFWNRYNVAVDYINSQQKTKFHNISKEMMLYGQGIIYKDTGAYWYYPDNDDIVCAGYRTNELKVTDTDLYEVFFSVYAFDGNTDDLDAVYTQVRNIFYEQGGNGEIDGIEVASYETDGMYSIVIGNDGILPTDNNNTYKELFNKVAVTAVNILRENLKASDSLNLKSIQLKKDVYGLYIMYDVYFLKIEYSATNSFGGELDDVAYIGIDPKEFTMFDEMRYAYEWQGFQYASDDMKTKHKEDIERDGVPIKISQILEMLD